MNRTSQALDASTTDLVERLQTDPLARGLLDALPMPALLVNAEQRVVAANLTARERFPATAVTGSPVGEVFGCAAVAGLSERACGQSRACRSCLFRRNARAALEGRTVMQEEVRLRSIEPPEDLILLVSASPFAWGERSLALVLLQDVTALHRLRGLVSICAGCKKVRLDAEAWQRIEAWIERRSYAEFSHGLCPACVEELYGGERS